MEKKKEIPQHRQQDVFHHRQKDKCSVEGESADIQYIKRGMVVYVICKPIQQIDGRLVW